MYTGRDTKMSKNSKITANKFSTVEKTMNKVFKGRGRMRSFLEPKPKFGVTPFFKLNYSVPVFLIPI